MLVAARQILELLVAMLADINVANFYVVLAVALNCVAHRSSCTHAQHTVALYAVSACIRR